MLNWRCYITMLEYLTVRIMSLDYFLEKSFQVVFVDISQAPTPSWF